MLFPEADAQLLMKWIVKRIENTYVLVSPTLAFAPYRVSLC